MNAQHTQARNLYFQTDMKQADIASIVGISDRTLGRWIKADNWKQMKEAAQQAPIAIVEMLYKQLHALNDSICQRESPIPTLQEAEINRKLINSIDKLKKQASLSENIQVLMGFTGFLNKMDNELAKKVVLYADQYLKEKKGYAPLGFYEDDEEEQPEETQQQDTAVKQQGTGNVPQPGAVMQTETKDEAAVAESNEAAKIVEEQPANLPPAPNPPTPSQPKTSNAPKAKLPAAKSIRIQRLTPEQQQIRNAFYDEMYRFADRQFNSRK